jgi:alpha-tubulin suppressor-like RCC1 family protein
LVHRQVVVTQQWTDAGELFTFGNGHLAILGHGVYGQDESVPRLVDALVGKKVIGAAAGWQHTAVWTDEGELFTFGEGMFGKLGNGGHQNELGPRLVASLAGKKVIGAAAGMLHTSVWTEAGELITFGFGAEGRLGHGGTQDELVPRLVEALAGKKVVGAATTGRHTATWTDAGELFTFGNGSDGKLGHGGEDDEVVPRLVAAFAGKKVVAIGASAGLGHTAVWTEEGELFTFGVGVHGQLGHGGHEEGFVPRLAEALLDA